MNTKQRLSNDLLNDGEIIIEKRFVKLYESEIDKIDEQISDLKKLDQKDFDAKAENMTDAEKEKLFADMQQQFNQKRTSIEKEMADQVTGAVKSVASKRGLSLVVDKAAVIYGGTDITKDVSDSLAKSTSVSADAAKTDAAKTDSSTTK